MNDGNSIVLEIIMGKKDRLFFNYETKIYHMVKNTQYD